MLYTKQHGEARTQFIFFSSLRFLSLSRIFFVSVSKDIVCAWIVRVWFLRSRTFDRLVFPLFHKDAPLITLAETQYMSDITCSRLTTNNSRANMLSVTFSFSRCLTRTSHIYLVWAVCNKSEKFLIFHYIFSRCWFTHSLALCKVKQTCLRASTLLCVLIESIIETVVLISVLVE